MKTLKEIHAEANRYAPDNEALREAFVNGARFMATGRYYKEKPMFPKVDEFETGFARNVTTVSKCHCSDLPRLLGCLCLQEGAQESRREVE